jgi:hypothetical protein
MQKSERVDSADDACTESGHEAGGSTPRWLPVLAILTVVGLVVLFVVLHLTGVFGPGVH